MLKLHYLENSRSQRILWFLQELNQDCELLVYKRDPKTMLAPKSLQEIHPLGKSPVIEHNGTVIAESGAIIEYLISKFADKGTWKPEPSAEEIIQYNFWLHYAEGSLMTPLVVKLITQKIRDAKLPFFIKPVTNLIANSIDKEYTDSQISSHFRYIDHHLANNKFFMGDKISAVDIQMSFPLEAALSRAIKKKDYPHIVSYLASIHARPAYKEALTKGANYDYANS